ncbi:MAG: di-heme oxidoredictase family protein, partial [Polyangiaceae bacterium]
RGNYWRTTPLWGFRFKDAYLHDGRTDDAKAAILAHGGESTNSINRFNRLSPREQDNIVAFINTL